MWRSFLAPELVVFHSLPTSNGFQCDVICAVMPAAFPQTNILIFPALLGIYVSSIDPLSFALSLILFSILHFTFILGHMSRQSVSAKLSCSGLSQNLTVSFRNVSFLQRRPGLCRAGCSSICVNDRYGTHRADFRFC